MKSSEVALKFVSRINLHEVDGIVSLMTRDHVFVDSLGNKFPRPLIEEGWRRYFESVPDYRIKVDLKLEKGNHVAIFGTVSGTYVSEGAPKAANKWETPAAWRVVTSGGRVSEWQVYSDNEPIRAKMRGDK